MFKAWTKMTEEEDVSPPPAVTVISHGTWWINDYKQIQCPECTEDVFTDKAVDENETMVDGKRAKKYIVRMFCKKCKCMFFISKTELY